MGNHQVVGCAGVTCVFDCAEPREPRAAVGGFSSSSFPLTINHRSWKDLRAASETPRMGDDSLGQPGQGRKEFAAHHADDAGLGRLPRGDLLELCILVLVARCHGIP